VTLLGNNGAGKSTTLKTISGLLIPRRGGIVFDGAAGRRARARDSSRAGRPRAGGGDLQRLTVRRISPWAHICAPTPTWRPTSTARSSYFPSEGARDPGAGTLSGGEQQMLAIARALMARPRPAPAR